MSADLPIFEKHMRVASQHFDELLSFDCTLYFDRPPIVGLHAGLAHLQFYPPAADLRRMAAALIGLADAVDRRDCVTAPSASDIGARLALKGAL